MYHKIGWGTKQHKQGENRPTTTFTTIGRTFTKTGRNFTREIYQK